MASSQQQNRTSGGAGVDGSYGPVNSSADTSSKKAADTDNSLKPQAGPSGTQDQPKAAAGQQQDLNPDSQDDDAPGISRTSGGAGIGGSYGPAMMAEAAKRSATQQGEETQDAARNEVTKAEQVQQRSKL